MKVSVVIPAYNEELYIGRTLRAVFDQDYPDFEVIVVDNASTDLTAKIAREFPVKIVHEPVKGLLSARDRGRREASGDIIANVDADCLPAAGWMSQAVRHFDDPAVAAVTGPYDYYDGSRFFNMSSIMTQKYIYGFFNWLFQTKLMRKGAVLIGGNNLIRAETLHKAGGYNTAITFYGEDTDTAKRVARYGRVVLDRNMIMKTSARRLKSQGNFRLSARYIYHFFRTIFSKGAQVKK